MHAKINWCHIFVLGSVPTLGCDGNGVTRPDNDANDGDGGVDNAKENHVDVKLFRIEQNESE